jgi:hypothetical protein
MSAAAIFLAIPALALEAAHGRSGDVVAHGATRAAAGKFHCPILPRYGNQSRQARFT